MPKAPRLTAPEAERLLLGGGFVLVAHKAATESTSKATARVVVPFHGARILHPKIVRQVLNALDVSSD